MAHVEPWKHVPLVGTAFGALACHAVCWKKWRYRWLNADAWNCWVRMRIDVLAFVWFSLVFFRPFWGGLAVYAIRVCEAESDTVNDVSDLVR